MPSDILRFPAIRLAAGAGSFLRYLDRGPKELFFTDKPRSEDNFQTQNTNQKVEKSTLSILKIVKYSELTSADLVASPPIKMRKNKYKYRKNTGQWQCHMF